MDEVISVMSTITSYFQKEEKKPSDVIDEVEVQIVLMTREREVVKENLKKIEENDSSKRGKYRKWTKDEKIEVGTYANKHSVAKTVRDLSKKNPVITKQPVSDFRKFATDPPKKEKKRGRPYLLPDAMMNKTIELIGALRLKGAPVSTQIVNNVAKGIIQANDRSILIENGGYLSLHQQWGRNVLHRMEKEGKKMCKRRRYQLLLDC